MILISFVVFIVVMFVYLDMPNKPKIGTKQEEKDRQRFLKMYDDWKQK